MESKTKVSYEQRQRNAAKAINAELRAKASRYEVHVRSEGALVGFAVKNLLTGNWRFSCSNEATVKAWLRDKNPRLFVKEAKV